MTQAGTENENLRMARAEKAEKPARARAAAAEAAAAEAERKTSKLVGTPGKEQVPVGHASMLRRQKQSLHALRLQYSEAANVVPSPFKERQFLRLLPPGWILFRHPRLWFATSAQ